MKMLLPRLTTLWVLALGVVGSAVGNPIPIPGQGLIRAPVQSLVELRFKNVVRQNHDVSCGAAALATLITYYYGVSITEKEIIDKIFETSSEQDKEKIQKDGFSMLELKRMGDRLGFIGSGFRVPDTQNLVNLKVPAIALMNVRGYNHFVVIKGVAKGQVFIADPAFGNRSRPLSSFVDEWNNVLLVLLSRTRKGDSMFTLNPTLKGPADQVLSIRDQLLPGIVTSQPGEF